jgi:hypothetical protein
MIDAIGATVLILGLVVLILAVRKGAHANPKNQAK